jgi:hypothetical protein
LDTLKWACLRLGPCDVCPDGPFLDLFDLFFVAVLCQGSKPLKESLLGEIFYRLGRITLLCCLCLFVSCSTSPAPDKDSSSTDTTTDPGSTNDEILYDNVALTDAEIMGGPCEKAAPAGIARVRAACFEQDMALPYASEGIGDIALENALVRYVIRARSPHGLMLLGTGAGSLIDAMPSIDGYYERSLDRLQEFIPFPGLRTLKDPIITYGTGAPGEVSFVQVAGEIVPIPIADTVLPGMGVHGTATLTWTLRPDTTVLDLQVVVTPNDSNKVTPLVWVGMLFSGWLDGWTNETGIAGEPGGTGLMYAGISPEVSLGVYTESGLSFVAAGGLVLAMAGTDNEGPKNPGTANMQFAVVAGDLSQLRQAFEIENADTLDLRIEGELAYDDTPLLLEVLNPDGRVDNRTVITNTEVHTIEIPNGATQARLAWLDGPVGEAISIPDEKSLIMSPPAVARFELHAQSPGSDESVPARALLQNEHGQQYLKPVGVLKPTTILVKPGTYTITLTRGHEYEASVHEAIEVTNGATSVVTGSLVRVVNTQGWVACDFHLHSDFSTDSADPLKKRILEVAAEGVEFAVSTDHDFVVDYQPLRDAQGLKPFLQVTSGVEMSHPKLSHAGSFPWDPQPELSGQGAPSWYKLTPSELFSLLGMDDPNRVFQINHPRGSSGYHSSIKYNPETGEAEQQANKLGYPLGTQLTGFKYDTMEIYNGKRREDIDAVFEDWLSLLAQGIHIAGTGTSDSHSSGGYPGSARTYVWVGEGEDDPESLTEETIRTKIHAGHTMVVGGPFIEAWLLPDDDEEGSPSITGQVQASEGPTARLRVKVQAPSWMPADEIEIWMNQEQVVTESLGSPRAEDAIIRLDQIYELDVTKDSFFVIVVKGDSIPYPYLKDQVISFAGPLFLDMNGDAIYTPPGLSAP